jgi:FkbM family methyltransferase
MLAFLRWLRHGPLDFLAPVWTALGRRYRAIVRRFPGLTVSQKIGGYGPFKLLPEFTFSDLQNWGGGHNKGFRVCIEACQGKHCVFDVGAHVGFVAMPAASVLDPSGRLYAFEPAAANAQSLQRHLALNGLTQVEVIESLVGAEDLPHVDFYESVGPHGQNSIVLKNEHALKSEWGGYRRVQRPQISLDAFCMRESLAPEVIKIDVEGAEVGVLRGARSILRRYRPLIVLSVHPRQIEMAGDSLDGLRAVLDELGYDLRDMAGRPVAELKLDEYVVAPRSESACPEKSLS